MAAAKKARAPRKRKPTTIDVTPVVTPPTVLPEHGSKESKALAKLDGGGARTNLIRNLLLEELERDNFAAAHELTTKLFQIMRDPDPKVALRGIEALLRFTTALPAPEKAREAPRETKAPIKRLNLNLNADDARRIMTDPTDPLHALVRRKSIDLDADEASASEDENP